MNHYDKKIKKNLSISEIFKKDCAFIYSKNDYQKKNIKLIPHTKIEIKEYVKEMLFFVKNKYKVSKKAKKFNQIFWDNYINNIKTFPLYKFVHGNIKSMDNF